MSVCAGGVATVYRICDEVSGCAACDRLVDNRMQRLLVARLHAKRGIVSRARFRFSLSLSCVLCVLCVCFVWALCV